MKRYVISELKNALVEILKNNNVRDRQAVLLAETMLAADVRGVHTHGISVFPEYIKKIKANGFNLSDECSILKRAGAFALMDANNQLGMISACRCMELAIEHAATAGIYTVFCRNANTFGAAFQYAQMATDRGMIGICLSNSPSAMPAWGGNKKILGTNPFAIGIPAGRFPPILIDMATSVVAKSKINEARKQGREIPVGWAVDENGQPTTDPIEAIRGMVLPMAEHKGYSIALAIDVIAGVLSGAGYLNRVNRFYSEKSGGMNVGHCFIAIDPHLIFEENFYEVMDEYIDEVKASGDHVYYPGEKGHQKAQMCSDGTVELPQEAVNSLAALFEEYNIVGALVEYDQQKNSIY